MPPTSKGVWSPRNTTRKFPFRVIPVKANFPYKAPPRPKRRVTIEEAMTHEGAETLAEKYFRRVPTDALDKGGVAFMS